MTGLKPSDRFQLNLPANRGLYYGGAWHDAASGETFEIRNPATGESMGSVAKGGAVDADLAIAAARQGASVWCDVAPLERGRILRAIAEIVRQNANDLAMLDAADCGNPVAEMVQDAAIAAAQLEFFAGLVTEMKGASVPVGVGRVNFSIREPLGVVARILPFNHPFMFVAGKMAAPLAAGNSIILKPPEQAPLSSLRLAELCGDLVPPGVLNILAGGRELGSALSGHPDVAMVGLVGSVPTGRAVMTNAAKTLKPVLLELGGKNALIAFGDANANEIAEAAVAGMNFTWCGQSCGSTSRAFVHASIYDEVVGALPRYLAGYQPGSPTDSKTTMGAIASEDQYKRILQYIETTKAEGGTLIYGGGRPADPSLQNGHFIEPTVFEVTPRMTIAREEVFGPVLSVMKWEDEAELIRAVNSVEYGLTCSIWTRDIDRAYRTALAVQAGYVWINEVSKHFLGAPFGGVKQSGIGREECLSELLAFTQEKNIHLRIRET